MATPSPNVDDLILKIHSAALAADGWTRIVDELCHTLSADGASLVRPTRAAATKSWCHIFERDPSFLREYMDQWGHHDCWYQAAVRARRIGVGLVNVDSQLIDRREFERSTFFNDFLRRLDIDRMMNVCLTAPEPNGSYGPVALSFYRGLGKESFSTREAGLLSHLASHLTVAARNYWAAQSLRLTTWVQASALGAVTSAVFAINRSGQLTFSNLLGEEMIRREKWVRVLNGILTPVPTILGADRFAAGLHRTSSGVGSSILVADSITGAEAQVSITSIPPSIDLGFLIAAPASLVWITPTVIRADIGHDMALLFRLTPAERRIIDKLVTGENLGEVATSLRISIHTARTQLKSVLRKTGRQSQGQLLMLAARLATLSSDRG